MTTPAPLLAFVSFFVPGEPRSTQTGSVIRAGRRAIPLRRGQGWSQRVYLEARRQWPGPPMLGAVRLNMTFFFSYPKGRPTHPYPSRLDLENASKGLVDALQGVVYKNDSQVTTLHLEKRWAFLRPGVRVEAWEEIVR